MSEVLASQHAAVAPKRIAQLVRQYFRNHGNSDGDVARLPLRLDLGAYAIERTVIVNIQPRTGGSSDRPRYGIFWTDEEPGPLPSFAGELTTMPDTTGEGVEVALEGSYTPPLGALGAAADAIFGARMASRAAENFLRDMCSELEAAGRISAGR